MKSKRIFILSLLFICIFFVYLSKIQEQIFNKYEVKIKDIKEINNKILSPSMSDYEKVKAIHDYIVSTTDYDTYNYDNNSIPDVDYTAYGVIYNHIAVCKGYAEAFDLLANDAGIETKIVTGYANNISHAWNLVKIDNEWYHIDCTYDDPIYDSNTAIIKTSISYDYFLITTNQILIDHTSDEIIETCTSEKYMYQEKLLDVPYILLTNSGYLPSEISKQANLGITCVTYYFPQNIDLDSELISREISIGLGQLNKYSIYSYTPIKQCGEYYYTTVNVE